MLGTMTESYYTLLEVPRSASQAEIKEAFLKLIRQVHPDVLANGPEYWKRQAEEKSKDINEAYRVLSDPAKRSSYDQQLDEQAHQPQAAGTAPPGNRDDFSGTAAAPREVVRTWPARLQNFWQGRAAALLCFLVLTSFVWFLTDLIAGRRTPRAESSAIPEVQRSGPATPSLPAQKKAAKSSAATQNAVRGAYSIDVDTSTAGQDDAAGEVMQWNPRTKSWQRSKALSPGMAGKGVQSNMRWDPETNSWRLTDPGTEETR
jgi:curved DNA-binding protein CbpA